jgi:hypothetical protein
MVIPKVIAIVADMFILITVMIIIILLLIITIDDNILTIPFIIVGYVGGTFQTRC